jgi:hypothetical protein
MVPPRQRQRILRPARVGQRRKPIEKGNNLPLLGAAPIQRLFRRQPQFRFLGKARVAHQEPGIIRKTKPIGPRQQLPPVDHRSHRGRLAGDQRGARPIPFAAVLALRRGRQADHRQQKQRRCSTMEAGHQG